LGEGFPQTSEYPQRRKNTCFHGVEGCFFCQLFHLTSGGGGPNLESPTGFDGCGSVESDSPKNIALVEQGMENAHPGMGEHFRVWGASTGFFPPTIHSFSTVIHSP
jgi:hypothetical protein